MPCANTLGETPNPPTPDLPVAAAPLTPQDILRAQAALIRLVTLAIVLAVLETLGFRIRRDRRRRATPTPHQEPIQAPTEAACPKPPARPRPTYRYLDRASWIAMLDSIAQDMAPTALPTNQPAAPAEPARSVAPRTEKIPAIIAPRPCIRTFPPRISLAGGPAPRLRSVAPPHAELRQKARIGPTIQPRPFCYDYVTVSGFLRSLPCAPSMP